MFLYCRCNSLIFTICKCIMFSHDSLQGRKFSDHICDKVCFGKPGSPVYSFLANPLWSQALYDLVVSRRSLRFYLDKSFTGEIPQELLEFSYATAHQPGARYVPLYFLSGQLFTADAPVTLYGQLRLPTLILYDKDFYVRFDRLPELLQGNKQVKAARIAPTMGLPHWELPEETRAALETFWAEIS